MSERPATKRQLEVCKRIASRTGRTFAVPLTFARAHAMIGADSARRRSRRGARAPTT